MAILSENVNLQTRGQIGKTYIYWRAKGKQFRRNYVIPLDPKTEKQQLQRNIFWAAAHSWGDLSPEEQKTWDAKVKKAQLIMTGYNLYMREKMKEIEPMLKKITHGQETLTDGVNVILIEAVQLDRTCLIYNHYGLGTDKDFVDARGITGAYFSDSTHITAHCIDTAATGLVKLYYTIVEYV